MLNWLRDFWYQDLPDEMQRKMLSGIEHRACSRFLDSVAKEAEMNFRRQFIDWGAVLGAGLTARG